MQSNNQLCEFEGHLHGSKLGSTTASERLHLQVLGDWLSFLLTLKCFTFATKQTNKDIHNKTKDWALVQTAALAINQGFNVGLG